MSKDDLSAKEVAPTRILDDVTLEPIEAKEPPADTTALEKPPPPPDAPPEDSPKENWGQKVGNASKKISAVGKEAGKRLGKAGEKIGTVGKEAGKRIGKAGRDVSQSDFMRDLLPKESLGKRINKTAGIIWGSKFLMLLICLLFIAITATVHAVYSRFFTTGFLGCAGVLNVRCLWLLYFKPPKDDDDAILSFLTEQRG